MRLNKKKGEIMKLIGYLIDDIGDETFKVYTEDFKKFYKNQEQKELLDQDDLEMWSEWLNSPWSQEFEKYITELNCIDSYTPMDENEPDYRTYYQVVGYEGITAIVYGYGNTPQESLQDCINHFEYLRKEYNKEDISY